jgi:tetratricopeptide (TPR) repeat protein
MSKARRARRQGPPAATPRDAAVDMQEQSAATSGAAPPDSARRTLAPATWMLAALLVVTTVAVYLPVRAHPFVGFDDPGYVYENPNVTGGLSWHALKWALTSGYFANWHPLTWMSHMLDVQLFGLRAGPHHVVNLALHVVDTLLLFALLQHLTKRLWRSAIVAALFAVHPVHVESVAWIAERKDVLSTGFWFLTGLAYVAYVRYRRPRTYAIMCVSYALGLMAKPMLVTLPFTLLLLDVWPLNRVRLSPAGLKEVPRLVVEKIPLFLLAAASSVITFLVQRHSGAMESLTRLPLAERVANALIAYATYLGKLMWPSRLAVFYPHAPIAAGTLLVSAAVLVLITTVALRTARTRPYVLVGWLWFLGTLVPVIGIVQVGPQALADRYTYVPAIGVFVAVVWWVADLAERRGVQRAAVGMAGAATIALGVAARAQVGHWSSSVALWTHAVRVTPPNPVAENNLGADLAAERRYDEAIPHFREALRLDPRYTLALTNLARTLADQGSFDEAAQRYLELLERIPRNVAVRVNLGAIYVRLGRIDDAIRQYTDAIALEPGFADAYHGLALVYARLGRRDDALHEFAETVRLAPNFPEARNNFGSTLAGAGRLSEAIEQFAEAVRLRPDYIDARNNLGIALSSLGRGAEAAEQFETVVQLSPSNTAAHFGLASAYQQQGREADAAREYATVLRLDPTHTAARAALDALRRKQ